MLIKKITDTGAPGGNVKVTVAGEGGEECFSILRALWDKINKTSPVMEGGDIGEADYDVLSKAAEKTSALRGASRMIGNGDRSEYDLTRRLSSKGFSPESARFAAAVLKKNGYLNEDAACVRLAEAAIRSKHYGRRRMYTYLLSRGYGKEAARAGADSIPDGDYRDALACLMEKKYPHFNALAAADKKKAAMSLIRLGYTAGEIFSVADEAALNNNANGEDAD